MLDVNNAEKQGLKRILSKFPCSRNLLAAAPRLQSLGAEPVWPPWLTIRLMPPIMVMSPEKAHRGYLTQPFELLTGWQLDSNASEVSYIM